MAGLLVAIAIMGITLSIIMPTWRNWAKREKEAELIFRGEQYVRAIELYQRRFAGAYPADIETLIDQRFLRKAFTDPMTGAEFELLTQGALRATPIQAPPGSGTPGLPQPQQFGGVAPANQDDGAGSLQIPLTAAGMNAGDGGGIIGVVSSSTETSMAVYNDRNRYDEWLFVYLPQATQPGLSTGVPDDRGGVPGQGGALQPGPGGARGGFGNGTGEAGNGARGRGGRGGQDPRRTDRQPGVRGPTPSSPGISTGGGPPRR
jgi:type II secretory pathway pseudopilin PulG